MSRIVLWLALVGGVIVCVGAFLRLAQDGWLPLLQAVVGTAVVGALLDIQDRADTAATISGLVYEKLEALEKRISP